MEEEEEREEEVEAVDAVEKVADDAAEVAELVASGEKEDFRETEGVEVRLLGEEESTL